MNSQDYHKIIKNTSMRKSDGGLLSIDIRADILNKFKKEQEDKKQREERLYKERETTDKMHVLSDGLNLRIEKEMMQVGGRIISIFKVYEPYPNGKYRLIREFESHREAIQFLIKLKKEQDAAYDAAADMNSHMTERERDDAS